MIASYHCPGSVMFLFESSSKRVLYTGDFRLEDRDSVRNLGALHRADGNVVHLDAMYLDTTFFTMNTKYFPKRTESADALVQVAKKWLAKGDDHFIELILPANFGHEHLFTALWMDLKEVSSVYCCNFSRSHSSCARIHRVQRIPTGKQNSEIKMRLITNLDLVARYS